MKTTIESPHSQSELMKSSRFAPLFWTQFLGAFNDNFFKNALVILITFQGIRVFGAEPAQMIPMSHAIFILPYFLFSATAGQLADQQEKSALIRKIKIAEVIIMIIAAFGFIAGKHEFLFLVLFALGMQATFLGPLKFSILPQHLKPEELVGGNALIEAGTFLAILIGTILGGYLINVPSGTTYIGIGCLVFAAVGWMTSLKIPQAPASDPGLKIQWNPFPPTLQMIRFARETRSVYLSILGISWFWLFGSSLLSIFPTWCKEDLHAGPTVVTLFLAIFSIGIAIGSLFCEKLSHRQLELGLVPFGSIGISIFTIWLALGATPHLDLPAGVERSALEFATSAGGPMTLVKLGLLSVFSGFFVVPLYTLMQERSNPHHRSRIIAANNILNACFMVIGSVLLVYLRSLALQTSTLFLILAGLNILVSAYIFNLLPEFLFRFVAWILANLVYRLKMVGRDRIPIQGPLLIVANHISFVDWLLMAALSPRPLRFVMDHRFVRGPISRWLFTAAKVIPIATAKENPATLERAFELIAQELRAGEAVCIFPEGKITFDGQLNPFKPGIERMLKDTPVPVLPVAICGMWKSLFSRRPGTMITKFPGRLWAPIQLRVGTLVSPEQASAAHLQERVAELLR